MIFVNRNREKAILESAVNSLLLNNRRNLAFIGMRRIGKTMLLKKFLDEKKDSEDLLCAYIDLEDIASSPRIFSIYYTGELIYALARKKGIVENKEKFFDPVSLLSISANISAAALEISRKLFEDLNKVDVDYFSLVKFAFSVPQKIAKSEEIKVTVALDEFQELKNLNNFAVIKNIFSIFRAEIEKQQDVGYVACGSAISMIEKVFKDHESPLFAQFKIEKISPFTREDSVLLASKIFELERKNADALALNLIYKFSFGHPSYVTYIANSCCELSNIMDKEVTSDIVENAFIQQVLSENGQIAMLCNYIYNISIDRVQGMGSLKSVLNVLARDDGLTLSEISKKLNQKTGVTSNLLKSLLESDLVVKKDMKYYFRDPVLRFWLAKKILNLDINYGVDFSVVKDLISELEEKYLRVSSEPGKAKETELKQKIERYLGMKLKNYRKNSIKFDFMGRKKGVLHIIEIKWRNKASDYNDIAKFIDKTKELKEEDVKLYFISKSGFTNKAKELMKNEGILDITAEI